MLKPFIRSTPCVGDITDYKCTLRHRRQIDIQPSHLLTPGEIISLVVQQQFFIRKEAPHIIVNRLVYTNDLVYTRMKKSQPITWVQAANPRQGSPITNYLHWQ